MAHLIYEGPSELDGKPIAVLGTGIDNQSSNRKTGPMLQSFILRSDVRPVTALKTGDDSSVCGTCPHRNKSCYVNVGQAPTAVYDAYRRQNCKEEKLAKLGMNRYVRVGSYGDPSAVPVNIWEKLIKNAAGYTGYTHGWRNHDHLQRICMASVDTPEEFEEANDLGWKTFRVKNEDDPLLPGETVCPASEEGGNKVQCFQCLACNGNKTNIAINIHGAKWKRTYFADKL